jgi:ABC-2 type transport system ATP-binding protein
VGGFDVTLYGARVRKIIGVALQDVALDVNMTGREHMLLQGALHGLTKRDAASRGAELLARVGLTDAADRRVGGYSGGMKRRLDLALALVHHPSILFLDEPTTGLDVQSRQALWGEVRALARAEGATVFLTTQYLEEADALCDRVGIIHKGRIVAEGTPAALKAEIGRSSVVATPVDEADRPEIEEVLEGYGEVHADGAAIGVRLAPDKELTDVVRALDRRKLKVADFALHQPSLDDVFLAKTGLHLEGAGEEQPETA